MQGGLIQDISVPPGVKVTVVNFDADASEANYINWRGELAIKSDWTPKPETLSNGKKGYRAMYPLVPERGDEVYLIEVFEESTGLVAWRALRECKSEFTEEIQPADLPNWTAIFAEHFRCMCIEAGLFLLSLERLT